MLIDEVSIMVRGGNGGNGSANFKRNAQTAKGGPDGGNGGNGGNVYVAGVNDILALSQFQFKKKILAQDGVRGGRNNLYGKTGEDTTFHVPFGTQVINEETEENFEILDTKPILVAKGGRGGLGNNALKSALNQSPMEAEHGTPGEVKKLRLILHLIADIGLVGLPNAGKSSLLAVLTNAKPKIANYPFTTLEPNLGVFDKNMVIADIPGLIEGASGGKGLGIKFLKHIEKTKILLHCIDASSEDPLTAYHTVRQELLLYNSTLSEKKEMILLTKTDLVESEKLKKLKKQLLDFTNTVLTVSIYDEKSLEVLKNYLEKTLEEN